MLCSPPAGYEIVSGGPRTQQKFEIPHCTSHNEDQHGADGLKETNENADDLHNNDRHDIYGLLNVSISPFSVLME